MDILSGLLSALPGIFFWSIVLSFIPNALYCIIRESRAYREEIEHSRGIFVFMDEDKKRREDMAYYRGIFVIYGVCFLFFVAVALFNWFRRGQVDINPLNILSSTSVVLFWMSALSYIPFLLYLAWKEPELYRAERARFKGMFIFYGVCLLVFSVIYSFHWLKTHQIPLGLLDFLSSIFTIVICSTILAYLPILIYMFSKAMQPRKREGMRFNVIFVIYSICFVVFSCVYVYNWIADRRAGVELITPQYYK